MSQTQVEKGAHRVERKTHRNGYRGRVPAKKALRLRMGRHRYFGKASAPGFILGGVYA